MCMAITFTILMCSLDQQDTDYIFITYSLDRGVRSTHRGSQGTLPWAGEGM